MIAFTRSELEEVSAELHALHIIDQQQHKPVRCQSIALT